MDILSSGKTSNESSSVASAVTTTWTSNTNMSSSSNNNMSSNRSYNGSGPYDDGFMILISGSYQQGLISDQVFHTVLLVVNVFCDGLVSVLGMVANAINVGVFLRMGVGQDTNNLTFLALSVSDFFYLLSLAGICFCWSVHFLQVDGLRWDPSGVEYVVFSRSLTVFSDTTCWLTAFLAIERSLCVLFPIRFRVWISPARTLIIVISIFVVSLLSQSYLFYSEKLLWVFDPAINATKLYAFFTVDHDKAMDVIYMVNVVILRTVSVLVLCVCTKLTTWKVQQSILWQRRLGLHQTTSGQSKSSVGTATSSLSREIEHEQACRLHHHQQQVQRVHHHHQHQPPPPSKQQQPPRSPPPSQSPSKQQQPPPSPPPSEQQQPPPLPPPSKQQQQQKHQRHEPIPLKELKMIKIISQICIIFIACYAPEIFVAFVSFGVPGLTYSGLFHRLYSILYYTCFFLGAVNSSINTLIYYALSSRYRREFTRWLGCHKH